MAPSIPCTVCSPAVVDRAIDHKNWEDAPNRLFDPPPAIPTRMVVMNKLSDTYPPSSTLRRRAAATTVFNPSGTL